MSNSKISIKGKCGLSLCAKRDEASGRYYTTEGCPNPVVTEGTAPDSVKRYCLSCPTESYDVGVAAANPISNSSLSALPPVDPPSVVVETVGESTISETTSVSDAVVEPVAVAEPVVLPAYVAPPGNSIETETTDEQIVVTAPEEVPTNEAVPVAPVAPVAPTLPTTVMPPSVLPVETVVVTPCVTPPESSNNVGFLPGMNLTGLADETVVDIDKILSDIEGLDGGPSSGGLSWHDLAGPATCWRKAYYQMILAIRKKKVSPALSLGSLVHACMELHYRSGGVRTFEACDAVAAAGAVDVAADARRYVYGVLSKYGQEEAATWDVRGVENQGTLFMPVEKINGKSVSIPLTCRHDLLVSLREPGDPCAPYGQPAPNGVFIVDHKTAKALTYDLTKGYGMDGQFLMNALIYQRTEVEEFGPFAGVIVSIIAKHKKLDPQKSFFRIHTTVDERSVDEFYQNEIKPLACETYSKLSCKKTCADMHAWPKNRAACMGPYGPCFYFDICDTVPGHEDAVIADQFVQQPERIKDVTKFKEPPTSTTTRSGSNSNPASTSKQSAKGLRAALKKSVLFKLQECLIQFDVFKSSTYLTANSKKKEVKTALTTALAGSWEEGVKFQLPLDEEGLLIDYTVTAKGISWLAKGKRGSWTFKSLAEDISKSWWDAAIHEPEAMPEELKGIDN